MCDCPCAKASGFKLRYPSDSAKKKSYFRKLLADPSICFLVNILICYIIEDLKVLKLLFNWLIPMFIYRVGFLFFLSIYLFLVDFCRFLFSIYLFWLIFAFNLFIFFGWFLLSIYLFIFWLIFCFQFFFSFFFFFILEITIIFVIFLKSENKKNYKNCRLILLLPEIRFVL